MTPHEKAIRQSISDALTGAYKARRLTQDVVADRAGMSPVTLQKKLKGRSPISATDLVILSKAIGVDPAEVLTSAEKLMSEAPPTLDDLRKRKQAEAAAMATEQLENQGKRAAIDDEELGSDEAPTP